MQKIDALNTALGALGKEPIADLSSETLETSIAAVKLLRSIETSRRTILGRHGWLEALEYATLAAWAAPAPYVNWRYPTTFLAPAGIVRLWEVAGDLVDGHPIGAEPRWEIGTYEAAPTDARKIIRVRQGFEASVCPGGVLNIAYVRDAIWPALGDHLLDAIALDCAWRQCLSITSDKALTDKLAQRREEAIALAVGLDATQAGGQPALAPSIPARLRAFAGNASGSSWGWDPWSRGY